MFLPPVLVFHTFLKVMVVVINSGLPQVCELWFGVINCMLPVILPAKKVLIAVIYYGRLLARRVGWVASAYHKEEGAAPCPGM